MKKLTTLCLAACLAVALSAPASALDYTIEAPGYPEYGKDTSIEAVYTTDGGAMKNADVSKNAALIPPVFGSPSADTLNTGTPLTPNLAPGYLPTAGAAVNGAASPIITPGTALELPSGTTSESPAPSGGFTEVTDNLYYSGGHLGTLKIPAIGLSVKIYEGTGSSPLAKGAGHFEDTSIWDGTVALAGHNRGVNNHFGQIHTLDIGDQLTLTTRLGTRAYQVTSVSKVSEMDRSAMTPDDRNRLVLYTCVRDQSAYRWCVQAAEK